MTSTWDPAQYLRYANERERPYWELVAHIPAVAPRQVVDLGCGPGTTTAGLVDHWPEATIVGIDNSPAMIEQAASRQEPPRLTFTLTDLATWEPGPSSVDVILSNATLHWVPDHVDLFSRWFRALRPNGVLAFQVPGNFAAPSHTLLRGLAMSPPWRDKLASATEVVDVRSPTEYHQRLRDLGATVDVWETTYYHQLTGPDPVLEWVRGSALRPYLGALDPHDAEAFTLSYGEALRDAYPPGPSGETLFPFRRVFVVATLALSQKRRFMRP